MKIIKTLNTETHNIQVRKDGIVLLTCLPNSFIDLKSIKILIKVLREVAGNKKMLIMLDPSLSVGLTNEAMVFPLRKKNMDFVRGMAVISNKTHIRIIMNFILKLNKTPFKMSLFENKKECITWLKHIPRKTKV